MFGEHSSNEKTKLRFYEAFLSLIQKKSLRQISITDIVEQSGLSRQTFYRNFDDIYDLLVWSFDRTTTGSENYNETKDFEGACTAGFKTMAEYPELYKELFLNDKDHIFHQRVFRSLMEYARKQIGTKHLSNEVAYALELFWSGYLHMVEEWVSSGMKESPELMGHYTYESLPHILKPYYHIGQ